MDMCRCVCGCFCVSVSVCVHACACMSTHMCKHINCFFSIFVFSIIYLNELSPCYFKVTG